MKTRDMLNSSRLSKDISFFNAKNDKIKMLELRVMKMMTRKEYRNDCIILKTIEELVPENHLVRKIEAAIALKFIEEEVKELYSPFGKPSIPPMILFKLLILNYMFGIHSMRKTCEECKVNLAYRWYLGLSIDDDIPNYSTWSQNYIRRYQGTKIFETIFTRILKQVEENKMLNLKTVFGDGTHQKANANKKKYEDQEVELEAKTYEEELKKEINEERAKLGKKPIKQIEKQELEFQEITGEEIVVRKKKHIKKSKTDPESGYYHKGEHEKCFAYTHQAFCDGNGFVLASSTNAGNMHDSTVFDEIYEKVLKTYGENIENVCLDSGYTTPAICKKIKETGKEALMPYSRPKGRKDKELMRKKEFEYQKEEDWYVCPTGEILELKTIDKQGYKIYKSNAKSCENCPLREKCTKSKNHQKVITRHIWQEYKEEVNQKRYEKLFKEEYPKRKQTIERIFRDCKEQHGLRFTRIRGREKNENQVLLIFACHNLKKMALWKWDTRIKKKNIPQKRHIIRIIFQPIPTFLSFFMKKVISFFHLTTLSTV